ncbi:hydrogenase expression/formation protein HypE [Acidihalobacter prosperus]
MKDTHISLAHGNGGSYMRELIETLFHRHLGNAHLDINADAACINPLPGELVVTTDGFTVDPLEFPGGNIGTLAVHGTINDLAVMGAYPQYLTLSVLVEEGFDINVLDRLIEGLAHTARETGTTVITGDTKVLRRGEGGGIYLSVTGIGIRPSGMQLGFNEIKPGDAILVSGPVGDHGVAVMLAREQFGFRGKLKSDSASIQPLAEALLKRKYVRFMRDPTRGGLATVANEIVRGTGFGICLEEAKIPVRDTVHTVCEALGYDPLYLACEGRVVAVVSHDQALKALSCWRALSTGAQAAIIGTVLHNRSSQPYVTLKTRLGGERILAELSDEPLPRIC